MTDTATLQDLNMQATKAAQKYMGKFAWPLLAFGLFVPSAFIALIAAYVTGNIPLIPTFFIWASLVYFSYSTVHEAAHGNISGNHGNFRWLNDLCGYLNAQLIGVPHSSHRYEHLVHHRFTNDPEKDPDYVISSLDGNWLRMLPLIGKVTVLQYTYPFKPEIRAKQKDKIGTIVEIAISLSWRIGLLIAFPTWEMVLLVFGAYIVGISFTIYWFAYRPHLPYREQRRYKNTLNLSFPTWLKPVRWFWLGQDIHGIHHLFPRVPFYQYRKLMREIDPALVAHEAPLVDITVKPQHPKTVTA